MKICRKKLIIFNKIFIITIFLLHRMENVVAERTKEALTDAGKAAARYFNQTSIQFYGFDNDDFF